MRKPTDPNVHGRHYSKQRVGLLEEIRAHVAKLTPEQIQDYEAKFRAARAVQVDLFGRPLPRRRKQTRQEEKKR